VHELAAGIEGVVVEGREHQRELPHEAVLHLAGVRPQGIIGPDFDVADLPRTQIHAGNDAAHAAIARAARPDDVRVHWIRLGPAALAAADRMPGRAGDRPAELRRAAAASAPAGAGLAGAHVAAAILLVAEEVIGNVVVGGDVVDLGDRQLDMVPYHAAIVGDAHAAVVGHGHVGGIGGINPHVVVVAAGRGHLRQIAPAIERMKEGVAEEIDLVGVVARNRGAVVIVGAALEPGIGAHHRPVAAIVGGHPEHAGLRGLAINGEAVAGLDHGVDAAGLRGGDGDVDLAKRRVRQAVAGELGPGEALVGGLVEAAGGAAGFLAPGFLLELPHAGEEDARIGTVHVEAAAASAFVHEERFGPVDAAVGGTEHAAVGLRTVGGADRAGEHDVGVPGIHHDAGDAPGFLEAHQLPGLARV